MSHGQIDPVTRSKAVRVVLLSILAANIVVVIAKLGIGMTTGSLAVIGDAMHSSVDAMNNLLGLFLVTIAARGPDEDHPYGHQKFETLGALAIVGFLSITGFELVKGAVGRLAGGTPPLVISNTQLAVLVGTLFVNIGVAAYESHKGRQLESEIILADATHTKADVFVTLGVLSGVLLSKVGLTWADPVVALAVAVVIIILAWGILARAIPVLVDKHRFPADELKLAAEAIEGVEKAYSIRSRGSRYRCFSELTISVNCGTSLEGAHRIADAVEDALSQRYGFYEVTVHIEPC